MASLFAAVLSVAVLMACGGGGSSARILPSPNVTGTLEVLAGARKSAAWDQQRLDSPGLHIVLDDQGNLYGTDAYCRIRRQAPDGTLTTIALLHPEGDCGNEPGEWVNVDGLARDHAGNFYLSDSYRGVVRKVTADGTVTVLAGAGATAGACEHIDGPADQARFCWPEDVAVDAAGVVYVLDEGGVRLRRISTTGQVSTVATSGLDGYELAATALAVDAGGGIVVTRYHLPWVVRIAPDGSMTGVAGLVYADGAPEGQDGPAAQAVFSAPQALGIDASGVIFVADTGSGTVRRIGTDGMVTTLAGLAGSHDTLDGPAGQARLFRPLAIAASGPGGPVVVFDAPAGLRRVAPDGQVTTLGGRSPLGTTDGPADQARLFDPRGLVADALGNLYVAESASGVIRRITPAGEVSTLAGQAGKEGLVDGVGPAARFQYPDRLAIDASGNLLVLDLSAVRRVTPQGQVTTLHEGFPPIGSQPCEQELHWPSDVAVDAAGNLYLADLTLHLVCKITPDGRRVHLAGTRAQAGHRDGPSASALFDGPWRLAMDGAGNLYVADWGNHAVRRITPDGQVSTVAGQAGVPGTTDGHATEARLRYPGDLAPAADGSLHVLDAGNYTIRRIAPDGTVSTPVGAAGRMALELGSLPGALGFINGLAIGPRGELFISSGHEPVVLKAVMP